MQAILLSIGDELALGQTIDTNSAWLAEQLTTLGVSTLLHETIADDLPTIAASIRWASQRVELLIITGGLGPTDDDLTREALARAMEVSLEENAAALATLEHFFRGRGYTMAPGNRRQALCPRGAQLLENTCGTAPGLRTMLLKASVFVTPGVPREMKAMYHAAVEPAVIKLRDDEARKLGQPAAGVILTTKVNTFGMGESDVAERLGELMQRDRNPKVGTTVSDGFCGVRVRAEFAEQAVARQAMEGTVQQVQQALGGIVFGRDDDTLQASLVAELLRQNATLATAESCTGGLLGAMITDVPGVSSVYLGGFVTYTNDRKIADLDVPESVIREHGAVSEATVSAMAAGALRRTGADYALSISGIAGPDGGSPGKPVGTVWIGLASRDQIYARVGQFSGNRAAVRDRAAKCALQWLRMVLLGQNVAGLRWLKPATIAQAD